MCYNYYGDLAVARSLLKKQAPPQPINSEMRNRSQSRRTDRSNQQSITKQILLDKEYSNLKHMLPSLNCRAKVSKVNLINEAVKYINELQEQVIQKLNADPQIIRQKILQEFDQKRSCSQNDPSQVNTSNVLPVPPANMATDSPFQSSVLSSGQHSSPQSISSSGQSRGQAIRAPMGKSLRRTPLEEISVKSVKRQRV